MINIIKYSAITMISLLFVNRASANVDLTIESLTTQNEYITSYSGVEYLLGTLEIGITTDEDISYVGMGITHYNSMGLDVPYGGLVEQYDFSMSSLSGATLYGYHNMFPAQYYIPAGTTGETLMYIPILISVNNDEEFCIQYPDFKDLEGNSLIVNLGDESCISIDELTGFDSNEETFGCTDFIAFNYNPAATADDGTCEYTNTNDCDCVSDEVVCVVTDFGQTITVPWCMVECGMFTTWDPITLEIIEPVIIDCEDLVFGCTDSNALNYDETATDNDGSCEYENWGNDCDCDWESEEFICVSWFDEVFEIHACELACGFWDLDIEGKAIVDCDEVAFGCTDSNALNYDDTATVNDGSCLYSEDEEGDDSTCALNEVVIQFELGAWQSEVSWSITDNEVEYATGTANNEPSYVCLPDGCYTLFMNDAFGDGWSGNIISLSNSNGVFLEATLSDGASGFESFALNSECEGLIYGCSDLYATNYNLEANMNDGSCEYGNANGGFDNFDSDFADEVYNLFEEFSGGGQFNEDNFQDIFDVLINLVCFPNPVEEGGMIEVIVDSNTESNSLIQIFNSLGQVVYSKDQNIISGKNRFQVDVENLEAGIYITTISSSGVIVSERFVKN
ncbi:MAG: T9SS type A sorting domain-containing protein [Flavobacteriales bacterium]|jgi:hypothetical protein